MLIIATKNDVLVYKGRNIYGEQQEQIQVNKGVQTDVIDSEQIVEISG